MTLDKLERFFSRNGRRFYGLDPDDGSRKIVLERKGEVIPDVITSADGSIQVKNSKAGSEIHSLSWRD